MKKSKLSKLTERLKSYSVAAGALTVAGTAGAQVEYTDIEPDIVGGAGSGVGLDLNADSVIDIYLMATSSSFTYGSVSVITNGLLIFAPYGNGVLGSTSYGYAYPFALNQNDLINCQQEIPVNSSAYQTLAWTMNYAGNTYSWGNFNGATDKYIGVRLEVGTEQLYGWIRISVGPTSSDYTIKDFAIETEAYHGILAGSQTSYSTAISNVNISDQSNNGNGSDLRVQFNIPDVEEEVNIYHIFAVKSANAATFTEMEAQAAITAGNALSVAPTGNNVSANFGATGKDVDGDLIANGVDYHIFVGVDNECLGIIPYQDSLASITLSGTVGIAGRTGGFNMIAHDNELTVDNFGNTPNLNLQLFNMNGQLATEFRLNSGRNYKVLELPSGIYVANIVSADGQVWSQKITVR